MQTARSTTLSRILKLKKESNLTAKDFAISCSLAPSNITDWKTGRSKPSVEALRKIAKVYKVQLEWLTGDSKYRTKKDELKDLKINKRTTTTRQ